jgi:hypothetical protein
MPHGDLGLFRVRAARAAGISELQRLAREHAIAAHVDEALESHELYDQDSEAGRNAAALGADTPSAPVSELYDQDREVAILPPYCGLCGYKFTKPPWNAALGSKCPMCGAITAVSR